MKNINFSYKHGCHISNEQVNDILINLKKIAIPTKQEYTRPESFIYLPFDEKLRTQVAQLIKKKRKCKPVSLVVIGIGGSNLGAMAIHEAIFGTLYNQQATHTKVYWADTVDTDYILDILLQVENDLLSGQEILINVISKSGTTVESIANFEIFYDLLKRNRPETYHDFVIATTGHNSPLWNFAQEEDIACLEIPKIIGGRYSVFSAVGLFPLAMLGIDIEKLHEGARNITDKCLSEDYAENPAALSAALLNFYYKNGICIHDMFLFSNDLQKLGMWYRQLLAESIAKTNATNGKIVNIGITPTVSTGSTDLHSLVQLHLAGPNNTFTTFVSVQKNKSNIPVPCRAKFDKLINYIQCKPLSTIMNAILTGTQQAYISKKRPFASIVIPEKNAYFIGQFMQMQMIKTMHLGNLLHIDPFNQPKVELYKNQTRKILTHE